MTVENKMKAIIIKNPGGPEQLELTQTDTPRVEKGQLLIKVAAAGVNRPDVMQREGKYNPPAGVTPIPGLEVAGTIVALGEDVQRYVVEDEVCALVPGGGYAEYCVVHEDNALPIPSGLDLITAAALPETYFTVWTNVFERGALKSGETLLVHGGTSGIGTTAIQMAKAFGARVAATAGSDAKCAACLALGADVAINYSTKDFVSELKEQGIAPDVILDMVGGDYLARNIQVANKDGRIVQIAFQKGSKVEVDFMQLMLKRLTYTGSTLRPRSVAEKASIARALEANVWPLIAEGKCKPQIFRTFPLGAAADAHRLMETSTHVGKIVLVV